jgi:hypothetical protein
MTTGPHGGATRTWPRAPARGIHIVDHRPMQATQ